MASRKEIIILSGSKNKGVVKLTSDMRKEGVLNGSCKLERIPKNATLYLAGDKIKEVKINKLETAFDTADYNSAYLACVLYADGEVLFGACGNKVTKNEIISAIENYRNNNQEKPLAKHIAASEKIESKQSGENAPPSDKNQDKVCENGYNSSKTVELEIATYAKTAFSLDNGVHYDGTNFYFAIKPQLDEMFICYPDEDQLNATVPNSKWVKIDADDGDFYVVGVLYSNNIPTYICYGVPGEYAVKPPGDMTDICVWLPLTVDDKQGKGYWVIYQSAVNGKIIR